MPLKRVINSNKARDTERREKRRQTQYRSKSKINGEKKNNEET